ncbi:MAG: aspartate ammonia-lyase [Kiritimatiellales bacterium]|nr:aspartate ammonia-lyase [Kiritimatiellales bacterium]
MRIEKDSLGEKEVPKNAYYGIHTCRSLENFNVAGEPLPLELVYGMVKLKYACAKANRKLGLLADDKADAIAVACEKILKGGFEDQFPIDVFQAGSGTSSNMNVNEVIANTACAELGSHPGDRALVHPNDDVNKGQSTNNIFPSAIRVAAVEQGGELFQALENLFQALESKADEFSNVRKSGRTHLQDAVPVTLGQEFGAWARALEKDLWRLEIAHSSLLELGVGGNAVGTGINTKPSFRDLVIAELNESTGGDYQVAENGIEITQFLTDMGGMSSALKLLALDLIKIVNDLRLLSSGPNTGLAEISLPAVEPGSSIMPGKINPSICEAANMACMQVVGNDAAVSMACAAGQLELNTHMPLVGTNLVKSIKILTRTCVMLADKCVSGITANEAVCNRNFEISAGLPTILNPVLGYDRVAQLVKESLKTGKTLKELVVGSDLMPVDDLEALLARSTEPNL